MGPPDVLEHRRYARGLLTAIGPAADVIRKLRGQGVQSGKAFPTGRGSSNDPRQLSRLPAALVTGRGDMMKNGDEPLRGEAAWRAAKADIAQRNDAACARAGKLREASEAAELARRRAADARANEHLPEQPRR
jgi:hypothetical protein